MKTKAIASLLLTALCLACSDVGEEPNVFVVRLDMGADTVRVRFDGQVNGDPIVLTVSQGPRALSAKMLLPDNTPDPVVTPASYELRITPATSSLVYFGDSQSFNGNLDAIATDTTTVSVEVVAKSGGDRIFGPVAVDVHARQ